MEQSYMSRTDLGFTGGTSLGSLALSQTEGTVPKSDFLKKFWSMSEEERQRYMEENFAGKYPSHLLGRQSLTPISEKDTIYEHTQKATIINGNIGYQGVSP